MVRRMVRVGRKRKAKMYRSPKNRAFTRTDIVNAPQPKIRKFEHGTRQDYTHRLLLLANKEGQITDDALEAARMNINHRLEESVGIKRYWFKIIPYPHSILRRHKMLAIPHADRMQTGMALSYGKPIGRAAVVDKDQPIIVLDINKRYLNEAKHCLKIADNKMPHTYRIEVVEND